MIRKNNIIFFSLASLVWLQPATAQSDGKSIFNGKNLEGWEGSKGIWRVENGAITAEIPDGGKLAKNEFIYWNGVLKDFELTLDYKITNAAHANSGIQVRSKNNGFNSVVGYQCDLDNGHTWLGVIYDEHRRGKIAERGGLTKILADGKRHTVPFLRDKNQINRNLKPDDWNQYQIKAVGNRIEIRVNGTLYNILEDYEKGKHDLSGSLALQLHSGKGPAKVQFKNIVLKEIKTKPETGADNTGKLTSRQDNPLFSNLIANPPHKGATEKAFVQPGFEMTTLLKEPDVRQPIAFTFDAKGRLWIAEAYAYPRKRAKGEGKDRLVIWEDKDNNGSFETSKVFADNLNLISGFEVGYGGVFVSVAPEIIFIPDADGDDIPDGEPKVLVDGWNTRDTHETPNSFMWGHDGWLYGVHGVFNPSHVGKPGTPKQDRTYITACVWRYHPLKEKFEIYAHGGSNQWGLDYDAYGNMFMTHCRSAHGGGPVTQVFRDAHYWTQNNRHVKNFVYGGWLPGENNANRQNFMKSVAAYGHGVGGPGAGGFGSKPNMWGGHSHIGTMIYLGDNWPDDYRHQLYTHNLHGSQINREVLEKLDSGYLSSSQGNDTLYVDDKNYVAVELKYGPDGAVYVIDWFDTQHCHTGDVNRWNRTNGRLYRVSYKPNYKPRRANIKTATEKQLYEYLSDKNEWFVRQAQHEIRHRVAKNTIKGKKKFQTLVLKDLMNQKHDVAQRFRYLVALHALGEIPNVTYKKLLADPSEVIRRQTIHYMTEESPEFSKKFARELLYMAMSDPSAEVRLMIASLTQNKLGKKLSQEIIFAMAADPKNVNDRFISRMLWYGYAQFAQKADQRELVAMLNNAKPKIFRSSILHGIRADTIKLTAMINRMTDPSLQSTALGMLWTRYRDDRDQKYFSSPEWRKLARIDASKLNGPGKKNLNNLIGLAKGKILTAREKHEILAKKGQEAFAMCATCHQSGKADAGPSLEEIAIIYGDKRQQNNLIKWIKKPVKKRKNYPAMPPFASLEPEVYQQIAAYLQSYSGKAREIQKKKK